MASNSSAGASPSGDVPHGNSTGDMSHGNSTAGGQGGGHGGAAGGGKFGGDPAKQAMFIMRQRMNEENMQYFAAALCGIIAIFIFLHWTRLIVSRTKTKKSPVLRPFLLATRRVRNLLVRACPGFNSAGHGMLTTVYVAINLAIIFTNVDNNNMGNVASRLGWVLMSNMCFVVFLSLKNTPLAFLTAYSYERLNNLHQIAGCTTFLLMVLHAILYTVFFWKRDMLRILREKEQIAGIVAGFAFLAIFLSAMCLRRYSYETFYVMHVSSFIISVVAVGLHRPEVHERVPIIICLTAGMFIADRLLRFTRFLIYSANNEAAVYPLPNGGTRIIMTKKPALAVPGKHCFVWIPKIRLCEMHPFSIIATQPMEFVVKEYNGFTRDLHAYAAANPGGKLRCSVEGPYGTFPDTMEYDKIVLIAGGSGASYTFGLAVNLMERMGPESTKNLVFIWTAKTHENLAWFAEHLETLRTHANAPKVQVSLYVTRAPSSSSSLEPVVTPPMRRLSHTSLQTPTSPDMEKATVETLEKPQPAVIHDIEKDMERHHDTASNTNVSETAPLRHAVSSGRPDTATLIQATVRATAPNQRVLVAACGPPGLMKVVRNATAKCIRGDGPGVELHCEQFGW